MIIMNKLLLKETGKILLKAAIFKASLIIFIHMQNIAKHSSDSFQVKIMLFFIIICETLFFVINSILSDDHDSVFLRNLRNFFMIYMFLVSVSTLISIYRI